MYINWFEYPRLPKIRKDHLYLQYTKFYWRTYLVCLTSITFNSIYKTDFTYIKKTKISYIFPIHFISLILNLLFITIFLGFILVFSISSFYIIFSLVFLKIFILFFIISHVHDFRHHFYDSMNIFAKSNYCCG